MRAKRLRPTLRTEGSLSGTLASQVEGVLFLVDAEHTDKRTAQAALEKLAQAHAPVVGAVINRAPP